jgi:hypothetical protein
LFTILLLFIESIIALYFHDRIIRPYVGDLLVVILIYCFCKSFFYTRVFPTAIAVLLFAYTIELLQYLNFVKFIGLENSKAANIIFGYSFEWIDMIAYTLGIGIVLLVEYLRKNEDYFLEIYSCIK